MRKLYSMYCQWVARRHRAAWFRQRIKAAMFEGDAERAESLRWYWQATRHERL